MNDLRALLNGAGWYLGHPLARTGWWYLFPLERDDAVSATTLINLLRLGGWDARPNRKVPTRVFVKIT